MKDSPSDGIKTRATGVMSQEEQDMHEAMKDVRTNMIETSHYLGDTQSVILDLIDEGRVPPIDLIALRDELLYLLATQKREIETIENAQLGVVSARVAEQRVLREKAHEAHIKNAQSLSVTRKQALKRERQERNDFMKQALRRAMDKESPIDQDLSHLSERVTALLHTHDFAPSGVRSSWGSRLPANRL